MCTIYGYYSTFAIIRLLFHAYFLFSITNNCDVDTIYTIIIYFVLFT